MGERLSIGAAGAVAVTYQLVYICSSHHRFTDYLERLAGPQGIQPAVVLTDSRQFSELVILETPTLLRIRMYSR